MIESTQYKYRQWWLSKRKVVMFFIKVKTKFIFTRGTVCMWVDLTRNDVTFLPKMSSWLRNMNTRHDETWSYNSSSFLGFQNWMNWIFLWFKLVQVRFLFSLVTTMLLSNQVSELSFDRARRQQMLAFLVEVEVMCYSLFPMKINLLIICDFCQTFKSKSS
jgi:hypothetical protein